MSVTFADTLKDERAVYGTMCRKRPALSATSGRIWASHWDIRWYEINPIREGKAMSSTVGVSLRVGGHSTETVTFVASLEG